MELSQTTDRVSRVNSAERLQVMPPPFYRVLMHNDEFTPMEFFIDVLEMFFRQPRQQAEETMVAIHRSGVGTCGVYPREIAETKVTTVSAYAKEHEHPLKCTMVEEDAQS